MPWSVVPEFTVHYRSLLARMLLPKRYVAITLSSHVLTRETSLDERVLRHEWTHVKQWRRFGLFGFLVRYSWYHFKYGYAGNPFEIEAREAETELGAT
jgi:hypothetical protein